MASRFENPLPLPLMWVALYSPHGTYDAKFLANYAYINLTDLLLLRSPGIGNVQVFGAGQSAMRLWVSRYLWQNWHYGPRDRQRNSSTKHREPSRQSRRYACSQGPEYTYTVLAQGRLVSPEEFGNIVVRETPDGATVRVRDVARIELGSQDYSVAGRFNGRPGAIIAAYQLPGSNAVDSAAER